MPSFASIASLNFCAAFGAGSWTRAFFTLRASHTAQSCIWAMPPAPKIPATCPGVSRASTRVARPLTAPVRTAVR